MERRTILVLLSLVLALSAPSWAADWAKYVAADGSFSIHYPADWKATDDEGSVEFTCGTTGEYVRLLSLPANAGDTPRAIAERVIDALRQGGLPDVTVKEWRDSDQPEANIMFAGTYTEGGRSYLADVLVAKTGDSALWVSYSVPEEEYSSARSQTLLAAMLGSLSAGDRSAAPEATLPELGSPDVPGQGPAADEGATPAPDGAKGEPLPPAGLANGRPQGLFVGVSVLSGNPAPLLFLDGGRVYHGIPTEGLNRLDWERLQAEHGNLCSRWEMQGNTLRIIWPNGNVWESPVEPTATGFRFNGKQYGAVHPVDIAHLAGSWEGTKSTAWLNIGYGPAMTQINDLQVAADGSYRWGVATGGDVGNATTYSETAFVGSVEIDGYEAVFHARDGKARRLSLARWTDADTLILGGAFYLRK
jgi:hypothetical protein